MVPTRMFDRSNSPRPSVAPSDERISVYDVCLFRRTYDALPPFHPDAMPENWIPITMLHWAIKNRTRNNKLFVSYSSKQLPKILLFVDWAAELKLERLWRMR